jgi:hypothetical protein
MLKSHQHYEDIWRERARRWVRAQEQLNEMPHVCVYCNDGVIIKRVFSHNLIFPVLTLTLETSDQMNFNLLKQIACWSSYSSVCCVAIISSRKNKIKKTNFFGGVYASSWVSSFSCICDIEFRKQSGWKFCCWTHERWECIKFRSADKAVIWNMVTCTVRSPFLGTHKFVTTTHIFC